MVWVLLMLPLLVCCAAATEPRAHAPELVDLPPFIGMENDRWLVQELGPVGRSDVLPAFSASAQNYGCRTERLGSKTRFTIQGERRSYYGISASCYEGTIAIAKLANGAFRIGCAKPTSLQACNQLLRDISESR